MIVLIIILSFLIVYYLGLSYLTTVAFKRKKINLSLGLKLFLPIYIIKTYIGVIRNHWHNKGARKKAFIDLVFKYDMALIILVEVVHFGFEKGIISSNKKEKTSVFAKISSFRNSEMKNSFSKSMESQLNYA
ncbi:hypothetical protein [Enterococcus dongliensis]|uniref:hypothetical protein n=1 Tax=Enterococcus dongliensis TaxID=2559925 RepID=UPI00288F3C36|nr:hypothetical protein [Enterococcus dongliensis]MDT2669162.1 hypothetical protein [Enterococcus dongliensis]